MTLPAAPITSPHGGCSDRAGDSPVELVQLTINGESLSVPKGTTLWEAARQIGIDIPALCHSPDMEPVAVCRVCVVEVQGSRVLPAACIRQCEAGTCGQTRRGCRTPARWWSSC
jgi:predicted molibdopterin-dependent oxidoreductase YjgC